MAFTSVIAGVLSIVLLCHSMARSEILGYISLLAMLLHILIFFLITKLFIIFKTFNLITKLLIIFKTLI